jgi:hypothetical protein
MGLPAKLRLSFTLALPFISKAYAGALQLIPKELTCPFKEEIFTAVSELI